jgi:hypothetical protein
MKRLLFACAGAAALLGVAGEPASAAVARNDGPFLAAPGSTLVIRINRLLRNDQKARGERIRFAGFNDHWPYIENISRRGNRLFIELSDNFVENTAFQYRIEGIRRVRGKRVVSRSSAFVKIQSTSPA